jgi:hypothetical protein
VERGAPDDFEARARLTALGWTLDYFTAWPEAECIPAVRWVPPGAGHWDEGPSELWERDPYFGDLLPPIPDEALEALGVD